MVHDLGVQDHRDVRFQTLSRSVLPLLARENRYNRRGNRRFRQDGDCYYVITDGGLWLCDNTAEPATLRTFFRIAMSHRAWPIDYGKLGIAKRARPFRIQRTAALSAFQRRVTQTYPLYVGGGRSVAIFRPLKANVVRY